MNCLKKSAFLSLAAFGLGFMLSSSAAPRPAAPHRTASDEAAFMSVLTPRNAEKIGLDANQRAMLKEIGDKARSATRELQAKVRDAVDRQAKLMSEAKPDEAQVMAAIDELFEARKEIAKVQTRRVLEVKALLTAEQLIMAETLVKERREKRRQRVKSSRSMPPSHGKPAGEHAAPPPPEEDDDDHPAPPPPPDGKLAGDNEPPPPPAE